MENAMPNPGHRSRIRWSLIGWGFAAVLLAIPFVAMQLTDEVDWTAGDFIVMGAMLLVAGLPIELAARARASLSYRAAVVVAVLAAFLLTWSNLAVGYIGDGGNPANLAILALPLLALGGAILARFRAAGMARAMCFTAILQIAIVVLAPTAASAPTEIAWAPPVLVATGLFAALWLLSAWLFRIAARQVPLR